MNTTPATPTYPLTLTTEDLHNAGACEEGVAAFRQAFPGGVLVIANVHAHVGLLAGTLAKFEEWAVEEGLLHPIRMSGGDYATLSGGYRPTLTGGYRSTLTGGHRSTLTGGDYATLSGGYRSTLTGGNGSTLTGGNGSTLTGGNGSTLTGGEWSTLTGGDWSTLTGGDWSILTGGYRSTLTGGYRSTLTGGNGSTLVGKWWDGKRHRYATAYVGEDGIEPGVPYTVIDGVFVRA